MGFTRFLTRSILSLPEKILIRMAGAPLEIDGRRLNTRMHFIGVQGARGPSLSSMSPPLARKAARAAFKLTNAPRTRGVKVLDDKIPGPSGAPEIPVRHYRPKNKQDETLSAIVYFHMGGWVIGDLDTCDQFCSFLSAQVGAHVMSVDYRLAPDHKFPAAMEDAFAAYLWLRDQADSLKIDADHIAVGGDSAGGCMAAVVCQEMKRRGQPQPSVQLMIYPTTDFTDETGSMQSCGECPPLTTEMMDWFGGHWLNDDSERANPLASPMKGEITNDLAAAIIVTAGFDPLRDQGKAYADRLQQAGVRVIYRCEDNLAHAFTAYAGLVPEAGRANAAIAQDLKQMI